MAYENTFPIWKKFYQIVSANYSKVTSSLVDEVIKVCKEKLVLGLLEYEQYSKKGFEEWKKMSEAMSISQDDELCSFMRRLSTELNLDTCTAWFVICNFLIFDYYGKVDELKSIIRYETNVKFLIDHIWHFYSSERMFLLKTLRYILEHLTETGHRLYGRFKCFVEGIDTKKLWKNLVKIFEILITEITKDKSTKIAGDTLERWIQRNIREQIEVLLLMILVIDVMTLDGKEITELLKMFIQHGFGRHPLYYEAISMSRAKDIAELKAAEIGLILTLVHRYWQRTNVFKIIPKELEKDLELIHNRGENSSVLFIWVIFKSSWCKDWEYCNNTIEALIKKKVFKKLSKVLESGIFKDCKCAEIVTEAMNRLMVEFNKVGLDPRFIYEQEGVVSILCKLMKKHYLHPLENFSHFFEISMDMFPYVLGNFLDICAALLENEECDRKVLTMLHNIPSFCTDLPWSFDPDSFELLEERNLFVDSNRFVLPPKTIAEKCSCYGKNLVKFKYKYNYFEIIDQYIRSLSSYVVNRGVYHKNILDYIIRATQFLTQLIKFYKGDFSKDTVIRPLLRRLDCVPTCFSKGNLRNFEFFYTYFEAKCALIIKQNVAFSEAFPPIVRKVVFPTINNYQIAHREMAIIHANSESVLYSYLKGEETTTDHKLLLLYLDLVRDILEKNMLYKEIVYPGVWLVMNIVYPLHHQWNYNDPFQQAKVLKACLMIITRALKEIPEDINTKENAQEVLDFVHRNLLNNECIIGTFCCHFIKDKFYLQTIMEQESNWVKGPSLIYIENIKLQLLLLLLLYKFKATQPNTKFNIDDKTHIFSKAACAYFVNSYNCALSLLSCKFLEVLARDENIPLMACLGLDGDQLQILFLDQLRDLMQDDDIKLNILNLISTCIFHQNGMTATFFNVQCSKKWYSDSKMKQLDGDTVGDFMIDYLKNIKKSLDYLRSPLQVGILKVMANLWLTGKQHLIKDVTILSAFWPLLLDPLLWKLEQPPGVYAHILKIFSIELAVSLYQPEGHEKFFKVIENFLTDKRVLEQLQKYMFKMFPNHFVKKESLEEQDMLIKSWTEILITANKQKQIKSFPTDDLKYIFIELALDGIKIVSVNTQLLNSWLEYCLIAIDMFGLKFSGKQNELLQKSTELCSVIKSKYINCETKERRLALIVIFKIIKEFKEHFEQSPIDMMNMLEEIGFMLDHNYNLLEQQWNKLGLDGHSLRDESGIWAVIISIVNFLLPLKCVKEYDVWFSYRKYLQKLLLSTSDFLTRHDTLAIGKLGLHGLILYIDSPLYLDFVKVNILPFYDRIEPFIITLFSTSNLKHNPQNLKEAWIIFTLILKLNQKLLQKFQKSMLETCYLFLTLYDHIISHIMSLPETTVDLKAMDLLIQMLKFYDEILINWKEEWYRKNNRTCKLMIVGVKKMINSCIYICLRPKHIAFYCMDKYNRITSVDQESELNQNLMITAVNKLIGALGIGFSCLSKLNPQIPNLIDLYISDESTLILIENDFSVPRFELPIPRDLNYGTLLCLAHFLCKTLNLVHQKKKLTKDEEDDGKYLDYIGVVEHQDPSEHLPNQKLSFFLSYTMYEYSGLVDPWTENLSATVVQKTLELLITFIGQQAFLSTRLLELEKVAYYKRNLCSELQFFNEYVKKHTSVIFDSPQTKSSLSSYKTDMDIVKRYLIHNWKNNKIDEVADNNFLLAMSYWFSNICCV